MSRDSELARTKYAGKKSATQKAKEKEQGRSRVPADAGGSVIDQLRAFNKDAPAAIPRDEASRSRARAHNSSLPPIGG